MTEPILEITDLNTKNLRARLQPSARPLQGPWRWPLPRLAARDPIVLADCDSDERYGVDLGYSVAPFGSELFVPVFAAQAGEVSFATESSEGFAVSIVHGDWTTHYAHLSKMFVTKRMPRARRRQRVSAGEVIGYAAKSPLHVRFELWEWTDDRGFVAVDPVPHLNEWIVTAAGNERRAAHAPGPGHEAA